MAVVKVQEVWSGREGGFKSDFSRRYARVFRVETDSTSDGPIVAGFDPAGIIPRVWDPYFSHETGEFDYLAICQSVDPRQDADNPFLWEVRCEYSTESMEPGNYPYPSGGGSVGSDPSKPGSGGAADNPEMKQWEIEWDYEEFKMPMRKAFDSQDGMRAKRLVPVVNSVGQPFDPLPEYNVACEVLRIVRIEANPDARLLRQMAYALNEDRFQGAEFAQAQLLPVQRKQVWIGRRRYWECTYRIRFCPEEFGTWQASILDAGRSQLQGDPPDQTKDPIEILYPKSHQPVNEDWPLDGGGKPLSRKDVLDGKVKYLPFYNYRVLPFSPLRLNF